jgi:hypothetical protein
MNLTGLLGSVDARLGLFVLGYVPVPSSAPVPALLQTRVGGRLRERKKKSEDPYALLLLAALITEDY